jgi:hypothetical protein
MGIWRPFNGIIRGGVWEKVFLKFSDRTIVLKDAIVFFRDVFA